MEEMALFDELVENLYSLYSANNFKKFFGFTQGETRVLLKLLMSDDIHLSPSELIDELGVSKQRITSILNSLKNKNYIKLEIDKGDKRKKIVTLTKIGREYISIKANEIERGLMNISAKLGEEKVDKLNELLEEINQIIE